MKAERIERPEVELVAVLAGVPDPRSARGIRYPLAAILTMAVCAIPGGARSLYAIAQWGREHPELSQTLGFQREKTPRVAILHHLFRKLDVDASEAALSSWAQGVLGERAELSPSMARPCAGFTGRDARSASGCRLRPRRRAGAGSKGGSKSRKKASEQTIAPALLSRLELAGKVVTGDALYA